MKLSRILELALVHEYGLEPDKQAFMCNAVNNLLRCGMVDKQQQAQTVGLIENLLSSINPEDTSYTLVGALHASDFIERADVASNIEYTRQLYVWWIFDLKRKGI